MANPFPERAARTASRPAPAHQEDRVWTRNFVALLAANLLLCFGFYMLPVTLPAYVKQLGGSNLQASLVIGLFSFMSLVSRVVSGAIVDAAGERRVIAAGIVTIVATTAACIWAPVGGVLFLRTVQGVGWGLATAAVATAVYKVVPESRRGEGSGYYALTVIASVSLTPLVGIPLMNAFDFVVVLAVSSALTLSSLSLLGTGLSTLPPFPAGPRGRRRITLASIFEPGALLPSVLCFILSIPLCGIIAFLVLFGRERGLDDVWVFFVGYAAMILVTRPTIGRLFDRRGHFVIVVPGAVAMIAGLLTLSYAASAPLLVASSLLYGLGYGAVQPSLHTWAVNRCPHDRKAAANGLFMSAIDLGYIVGAVLLGQLASATGFAAMYRYSALAMVAFLAVYLVDRSRVRAAGGSLGGR